MLPSPLFESLPWWAYLLVALGLTHVTIAVNTIYLHRHQAHRALDLHPVASHACRLWLWLTTGMVTREWVAVHRKHHATVETPEDPHSPQVHGIARVLWGGVFLYAREARDPAVLDRHGAGTPDDWLERHVYARCSFCGLFVMGFIDGALFGLGWGMSILVIQLLWVPFWAAGVVNGLGHYRGYRNYPVDDASTNLCPIGVLIGGEELHNNHHAYPTSARFSSTWYELDIGWVYIRLLSMLGLARVERMASMPRFRADKTECDADTVRAVMAHRYYVLAQYTRSVRATCRQQVDLLTRHAVVRRGVGIDAAGASKVLRWLHLHTWDRRERQRLTFDAVLRKDDLLQTVFLMRQELAALWGRSAAAGSATAEQSLQQLRDWRARAETSGIAALRDFARRLPQLV